MNDPLREKIKKERMEKEFPTKPFAGNELDDIWDKGIFFVMLGKKGQNINIEKEEE